MSDYRIRQAVVPDGEVIARHRVAMFQDMGELDDAAATAVRSASEERLRRELSSGEYVGWLAEADGVVVAGAGALLHQYFPNRVNPRGRPTAYILNVYTEPAHRRRGLARRLMLEILDWCRAQDIPRASLHASSFGRAVYEQIGFESSNEMRLSIGEARVNAPDR